LPITIAGTLTVDAPRAEVWNTLFDPDALKRIIARVPGIQVDRLEQVDDSRYAGTVSIGVAMVRGRYDWLITILEKRAPEFARVQAEGKGEGNRAAGELTLTLTAQDAQTVLTYAGQVNVTGPLASFGQRLVDSIGRQFIEQGTRIFAEEVVARYQGQVDR
jgi:carbon monoxide dehydrogenase subunit G